MKVYDYEELQNKLEGINGTEMYLRICHSIKVRRKELYEKFKKESKYNSINPYTTENIAALLDYSHTHYKRFESDNDSTKKIPLVKLVMLTVILDTTLDELIKK